MFKIGAALSIALIAALAAFAAGMITEARVETAVLRSIKCFFISGVIVFVAGFLFEKLGLARFLKDQKDVLEEISKMDTWPRKKKTEDNTAKAAVTAADKNNSAEPMAAEAADGGAVQAESTESTEAQSTGFAPLATDELRHVATQ